LLVENTEAVLLDVTRHFAGQAHWIHGLDAVLLTHGHRDAAGGLAQLRRWWTASGSAKPIPVYAHAATLAILRRRFAAFDHVTPVAVRSGEPLTLGRLTASAVDVPHARDCPTFAWRVDDGDVVMVYASDVARLTPELESACRDAALLVLDGAMWGRSLYTHLRIDRELPEVCRWPVARIVLTQIGRSAPPHERLTREVASLCARAGPAFDGMALHVGGGRP
jgi:glyoxylase-like metal-dependent hydrolase (beta-lactamase superfamily II)